MWIASYDYYMKSLDEIIKWLFDNVYFLTINDIDVIICPVFKKNDQLFLFNGYKSSLDEREFQWQSVEPV